MYAILRDKMAVKRDCLVIYYRWLTSRSNMIHVGDSVASCNRGLSHFSRRMNDELFRPSGMLDQQNDSVTSWSVGVNKFCQFY